MHLHLYCIVALHNCCHLQRTPERCETFPTVFSQNCGGLQRLSFGITLKKLIEIRFILPFLSSALNCPSEEITLKQNDCMQ